MLEGLQRLVDLSRLDTDLSARLTEREGLPARREACVQRRAEGEARLGAVRAAVEEAELALRNAEASAQDQEALLTKLEGQQHQVKTNDAYTALLHEMDQAREAISEAETQILEAMESIEAARGAATQADAEAAAEVARIETEEQAVEAREKELDEQIAALESRRAEICGSLEKKLLDRYEKIGTRRRPAIALVAKETCMGCRVGIPPQLSLELMKGEDIITCGHCQRILILDG